MPNYYSPMYYQNPMIQQPQYGYSGIMQNQPQYMINVDGEIAARAWQPQNNMPLLPNTVIPLWDFDGVHVYFKSTDAYGRMNPIRKGKVIFEDEPVQNLSGSETPTVTNMDQFVTKDDLNELRQEIRSMMQSQPRNQNQVQSAINQNGSRGGNK